MLPETNRPVRLTKSELNAWYSYGFAAEVFAVVSLTTFIPITLEQLAFDVGFWLPEHSIPCTEAIESEHKRCVVNVWGWWLDTASLTLYVSSLGVALQALTVISMSGAADHGSYRKTLLLTFAIIGATATMLFVVVRPSIFWFACILAIIGNVCFGASMVCLNGFLPVLVRNHWDVLRARIKLRDYIHRKKQADLQEQGEHNEQNGPNVADEPIADDSEYDIMPVEIERERLLADRISEDDLSLYSVSASSLLIHDSMIADEMLLQLKQNLTNTITHTTAILSARGFAIGYLGGILLLVFCLFLTSAMGQTTFSLQIGIFLSGLWWLVLSFPAARWLLPRPGPPLPNMAGEGISRLRAAFVYIMYAWRKLGKTIREAGKLRDTLAFLAGWFLLSDGYTTITGTAILFAKTSLNMSKTGLITMAILTPCFALIGALATPTISRRLGLSIKQTIIGLLALLLLIPLYGILGFLPIFRQFGFGGLTDPRELYLLAVLFGTLLGSIQSSCRALFGELVPIGREVEFFALYAVTDKGSSWLGPLMVGLITDATHEIRNAFFFLFVLIALPIPILLWGVDVERGRAAARKGELDDD